MDIPLDVEVFCSDGSGGHSAAVVLNPVTKVISHVVVKTKGHAYEEYLVPLGFVADSSVDYIGLRCSLDELGKLTPFMKTVRIEEEAVPETELTVRTGTPVHATDGAVGQVDRFFIHADSGEIMQLVLLEKHLLSKKNFVIPVDQIDRIGEDTVYVALSKYDVEQLPRVSP